MKIVVRGTNWIGDGVMTVPALRELRRIFPAASITLHTRSWAKGVFEDADFIDELLTFDAATPAAEVLTQSRELRRRRFDLGIVFPNSFASALTLFMAGIKRRIGHATDGRGWLLTEALEIPKWKSQRHEVFYYLNVISAVERSLLGTETISNTRPDTRLNVSDERKAAARQLLAESGIVLHRPVVALGVGSTNSLSKRWGAERYAQLNDLLQSELDANVVIVGSADEASVAEKVSSLSSRKPVILTGKTNLGEATALLSVVDLMISNDMGLAHVAPATGTKTIVIFGPTNPVTTRPFSENGIVLQNEDARITASGGSTELWPSINEVYGRAAELLEKK